MRPSLLGVTVAGAAVAGAGMRRRRLAEAAALAPLGFTQQYGPWAVVTGAARAEGIGFEFARQLAGKHVNLVLVDVLGDELDARADELRGTGVDVLVVTPGLTNTQGDGLAGYPQVMVMEVEPVVTEALGALGNQHLLVPGSLNKVFHLMTSRFMSRRRAVVTNGDFMAKGLGRDRSRPLVGPLAAAAPGETGW